MESLEKAFDYVDKHFPEMCRELEQICSYPSTAQNKDAREQTCSFLCRKLESIGVGWKQYPVKDGNPIIYGEMEGKDSHCTLFYNHYDVVDGGEAKTWITGDPYGLHMAEGKMYARGISDNKGALLTRVHAVQAILAVCHELPSGIKFLWEGDEEIGSPSLARFIKEQRDVFRQMSKADVCIWENGRMGWDGRPWARYGVRGSCCFNLTLKTADAEAHTRLSAVIPNAAWRLCEALATLRDKNGNIAIENIYDHVRWPEGKEAEILNRLPYDTEKEKKSLGLERYLTGIKEDDVKRKIYTEPSLCLCGLDAGGLFQKTRGIIPNLARAVICFELVADLTPDYIEKQLRKHFENHGFGDIAIESWGKNVPVKTPVDIPFTENLKEASRMVCGKELVIEPIQLGPGPAYLFRDVWPDLPIVGIGPGNHGSNHHSANENLLTEDYKKAVKQCIALLYTCKKEGEETS